jgi:hypothetical protein
MTETAVPDDLMKVAREVADDHDAKMKALYGPTASTRHAYMIELIAVALAAERERATLAERARCAGIAERAKVRRNVHAIASGTAALIHDTILARP